MKRFAYTYETLIRFNSSITRHFFRLRCMPCDNAFQTTSAAHLDLLPCHSLHHDCDAFGNRIQYGEKLESHDLFVFISEGEVIQSLYQLKEGKPAMLYQMASCYTQCSSLMHAFLREVPLQGTNRERALQLAFAIHTRVRYHAGSTQMDTTAAQAFQQGMGVCQDYAHILIALCRALGIPARYVNGLMQGEGQTHAWVEVYDTDRWYAVDPTNQVAVTYGYIKIAHGRDASDCPVNRGVYSGNANQQVEIRVIVKEI